MTRPRRDAREHVSLEDMSLAELRDWTASYGRPLPPVCKTKPAALAAILAPLAWPAEPISTTNREDAR